MQVTVPDCEVLCLYGMPGEEILESIKLWLEENQDRCTVIFGEAFEEDHPQIRACGEDVVSIESLAREKVFLRFGYLTLCERDELFFAKFDSLVEQVAMNASDFQNRGVDRLSNLLKNSNYFSKAREAKGLFGTFSQIPAIICGAGPSLEKEISYLRLLRERALLFAGGTALSSLSFHGISPHFGAVIDPHRPSAIDFASFFHDIPCFFQTRAHPDKLRYHQGPLLLTPGSSHDFFEQDVFEGGWNVSTYLAVLACHMGCNPIILAGVDLRGLPEKTYAGGLEREENLIETHKGEFTKKDWLLAAAFLSNFAKKHPETRWINVSHGIELDGFEKQDLRQVSLESEYDLAGMTHAATFSCNQGVRKDFDQNKVVKSLGRLSALCGQILEHLEKSFPKFPEKDVEYTLLTFEVEREEAYSLFAKQVWEIWKPVVARSLSQEIPRELGLEINRWLFIKGICDDAKQI